MRTEVWRFSRQKPIYPDVFRVLWFLRTGCQPSESGQIPLAWRAVRSASAWPVKFPRAILGRGADGRTGKDGCAIDGSGSRSRMYALLQPLSASETGKSAPVSKHPLNDDSL